MNCLLQPTVKSLQCERQVDCNMCHGSVFLPPQIEPFFLTLALYDAQKGVKISENFHVDLNSPALRQMVPPSLGTTEKGPHFLSDKATRATTVSS